MRKFLVAIALLIGVAFFIGHVAELQSIGETFQRGDLGYLTLAFILQLFWILNTGASYQAVYRALGIEEDINSSARIALASLFINVIAPSAGIGGMAVLVAEARRKRYSSARATIAGVLYVLFEYAAFLVILGLGLLVLFRRNHLGVPELIASGILITIALTLSCLLVLGMRSTKELGNALAWIARQVNRVLRPLLRRPYLSEQRAHEFAADAKDGLGKIRGNPESLLLPMALALSSKALLIAIFFLVFLGFQVPFSPGTLIAGFSIGYLFTIVSPTPAGVGVVEGILTLTLTSLYVTLSDAAVITLAYRGLTFWVPLFLGVGAFRTLGRASTADRLQPRSFTKFTTKQKI
jgi:uncharacterized protein (TIRG00374 family)